MHQKGPSREKAALYFWLVFSHGDVLEDSYQLSLLEHIPYLQVFFNTFFLPLSVPLSFSSALSFKSFKQPVIRMHNRSHEHGAGQAA